MECHNFYTHSKISFTKNVHPDLYKYSFYMKEYHIAYLYNDTYKKYYDNMFELWNILSKNNGNKLETIEDDPDNDYKNQILCYYEDNTEYDADEIMEMYNITNDDIIVNESICDIYWE